MFEAIVLDKAMKLWQAFPMIPRAQLERDLDAWIKQGLVPAESREAILASAAAGGPPLSVAATLKWAGFALLGVAVLALLGALTQFLDLYWLLILIGALLGGTVFALIRLGGGRPRLREGLCFVAALLIAGAATNAAHLLGRPEAYPAIAGLVLAASFGLGLAFEARAPVVFGVACLVLAALNSFAQVEFNLLHAMLVIACGGLYWLMRRWRSRLLLHGLLCLAAFTLAALALAYLQPFLGAYTMLICALIWAGVGFAAWRAPAAPEARLILAYAAWFGLAFLFAGGAQGPRIDLLALVIIAGLGVSVFGRVQRRPAIALAGVVHAVIGVLALPNLFGDPLYLAIVLAALSGLAVAAGVYIVRKKPLIDAGPATGLGDNAAPPMDKSPPRQ